MLAMPKMIKNWKQVRSFLPYTETHVLMLTDPVAWPWSWLFLAESSESLIGDGSNCAAVDLKLVSKAANLHFTGLMAKVQRTLALVYLRVVHYFRIF
jgi:hypothetical protein